MMTGRATRYLKLILLVVMFSGCSRLYFLLINYNLFKSQSFWSLTSSFFKGFYSDISIVIFVNLLFTLVYFFPKTAIFQNKKYSKVALSVLFWTLNIPSLLIDYFNAQYYKLASESISSLSYSSMTKMGEFQFVFSYLLPRALLIVLIVVLFVIFSKKYLIDHKEVYSSWAKQFIYFTLFFGLSVYVTNIKVLRVKNPLASPAGYKYISLQHLENNIIDNLVKNYIRIGK